MISKSLYICVATIPILYGLSVVERIIKQGILCLLATASTVLSSNLVRAVLVTVISLLCISACESIFDTLHLHALASRIRGIKACFESKASLKAQTKWIKFMTYNTNLSYEMTQAREYAKWRLEWLAAEPNTPVTGNKETQHFQTSLDLLRDSRRLIWHCRNERYNKLQVKPRGARVREYEAATRRRARLLEKDPKKFMAQPAKVLDCRLAGGCCGRGCGCCLRPRAIYPDGKLFYSHCTRQCGCYIECLPVRGSHGECCTVGGQGECACLDRHRGKRFPQGGSREHPRSGRNDSP